MIYLPAERRRPAVFDYIIDNLLKEYPGYTISIDVGDCDKVLRVEGTNFRMEDTINRLQRLGFACEELI